MSWCAVYIFIYTSITSIKTSNYNSFVLNFIFQNIENSEIIAPCFIGENANIKNSKIGPHVSIGSNTQVENSSISKTIIQDSSVITNAKLNNSMLGNLVNFNGKNTEQEVSIGDFSEVK